MIETLLDLLGRMERLENREAVRFFNGYRTRRCTYRELTHWIAIAANHFSRSGLSRGDRLILWGESSPEWIAAFWGAVARGIEVVPLDENTSAGLVRRLQQETGCKLIVHSASRAPLIGTGRSLPLERLPGLPSGPLSFEPASADDVVQIVFTSGTTGDPKGVVHRHRNLCANLSPFDSEFQKYGWLSRPFQPLRIANLLPLSHMFGQAIGLFVPVLIGGSVFFTRSLAPHSLVKSIRRERINALATVPKIVDQLRNYLIRYEPEQTVQIRTSGKIGFLERWLKYRNQHSALGWRFWALIVGGASLGPQQEAFWNERGFLVLQGYGLTEAGPIISVNHPFRRKSDSIGKVLPGQEVKLGEQGEILVRGPSVAREYFSQGQVRKSSRPDGWLPTGDVGRFDANGNLYFQGRIKDVIVTADGMNVYPRDIEPILRLSKLVSDAVVIGTSRFGQETIHAVIIPADRQADLNPAISEANRQLEAHQRIRSWSVWPEDEFPRTPSTLKIRRSEIRSLVEAKESVPREPYKGQTLSTDRVLARLSGRDPDELRDNDRLGADLGLTSLDRIELLSGLEEETRTELDESSFSGLDSVRELHLWLEKQISTDQTHETLTLRMPRWSNLGVSRLVREVCQRTMILPLFRRYIQAEIGGSKRLHGLETPVIFAANHSSHLDTIAILSALPRSWRTRICPAIQMERFESYFSPGKARWRDRLLDGIQYCLACLLFNTFPLPQKAATIRQSLLHAGQLAERGFSILIFPEGRRTLDGRLLPFRHGSALMAQKLQIPILPIYLHGLFELMPRGSRWPSRGNIKVNFGSPFEVSVSETPDRATRRLEQVFVNLRQEVM